MLTITLLAVLNGQLRLSVKWSSDLKEESVGEEHICSIMSHKQNNISDVIVIIASKNNMVIG